MSTPILVVTSDAKTLESLNEHLARNGFDVVPWQTEDELIAQLRTSRPALVVVDVQPGFDVPALCRSVRATTSAGIVILSTIDDPAHVASVFEAGADDYVRKPFGEHEVIQRLQAILRRTGTRPALAPRAKIEVGPLQIDTERLLVTARGSEIPLTLKEFALLVYFAQRQDHFLTSNQILTAVWGVEYVNSPHIVATAVSRLRKKLDPVADALVIQAVPSVGYRLGLRGDTPSPM